MAEDDAAKDAWVLETFGLRMGTNGAGAANGSQGRGFGVARGAWSEAIEQVNGQISALQTALKASGDKELAAIGEYGLNGVTGNHAVRLTAALMDIGAGPPTAKNATAAISVIKPFRDHLASDERVTVCDDNPFGVAVAIRSTLVPALEALQKALEGAAG